jgi:hypothetical protein
MACGGPDEGVEPGLETGPCIQGACLGGLECASDLCVLPGAGDTGAPMSSGSTPQTDDGGTTGSAVDTGGASDDAATTTAAEPIEVTITPSHLETWTTASADFTVTVSGTPNPAVTFTLVEADAGEVDDVGQYTAPLYPGTFHLQAASVEDPTAIAEATIVVTDRAGQVDPGSGPRTFPRPRGARWSCSTTDRSAW